MKRFWQIFFVISFVSCLPLQGWANQCNASSEVQEAASALLCKQNQCQDLNKPNEKGNTPEEIYLYHCSDYARELRQTIRNATVEIVIFELERTRFPEPIKLTPPCECLAMLKTDYPDCEVRQCESEMAQNAEKSATPNTGPAPAGVGPGFNGGGCTLQSAAPTSYPGTWFAYLVLGLLPAIKMYLKK